MRSSAAPAPALICLVLAAAAVHARRVKPSHDLPVLDLIEPKGTLYDPRPEDMDPRSLRARLGPHYDPRFMSETKPNVTSEKPSVPPRMPRELRRLKLHALRLPDGSRVKFKVGKRMRRKLKQLLWAFSYCPVAHRWKDLGVRFWPRWLKEGSCPTARPCGALFPLPGGGGMACKPSRASRKTILRWHCLNWSLKKRCKWIPVRYPIITACKCSCSPDNRLSSS